MGSLLAFRSSKKVANFIGNPIILCQPKFDSTCHIYYLAHWRTVRAVTNCPEDRAPIPARVIPKSQKMELDMSFLNIQHYNIRIKGKWSNLEKGVWLFYAGVIYMLYSGKTCRKQWTIERGGKRGSGISALIVRHDDDDDDMSSYGYLMPVSFICYIMTSDSW